MADGFATVGAAVAAVAARLASAGIGPARMEARLIVARALDIETARVLGWPEAPLDDGARARIATLAARRAGREPMAHILGIREFWGLPFATGPAALVPRPDTEAVVELALETLPGRGPARVLDLGTGTGCILLALLHERPDATGLGVDVSPAALDLARANARALGLAERARFAAGDWCDGLAEAGRFDLIVSNPPYIPAGEIAGLEPEVARFDPRAALDGGADGLDAYRRIAAGAGAALATGGRLVLEIGAGQAADVGAILAAAGFEVAGSRTDLGGRVRALRALSTKNP